jgi:hypothetical protein
MGIAGYNCAILCYDRLDKRLQKDVFVSVLYHYFRNAAERMVFLLRDTNRKEE